jgi:hypothetical protein
MKVLFLMLADVEIESLAEREDPVAAAQATIDAFRELSLPNHYGISLYRTNPGDMPHVDKSGVALVETVT